MVVADLCRRRDDPTKNLQVPVLNSILRGLQFRRHFAHKNMEWESASSYHRRTVTESVLSWPRLRSILPKDAHPYEIDELITTGCVQSHFDWIQDIPPGVPLWFTPGRLPEVVWDTTQVPPLQTVLQIHQQDCSIHQNSLSDLHFKPNRNLQCPWGHVEAYMRTSHRCHPLLDLGAIYRMYVDFQFVADVGPGISPSQSSCSSSDEPLEYVSHPMAHPFQYSIDCGILLLILAIGEVQGRHEETSCDDPYCQGPVDDAFQQSQHITSKGIARSNAASYLDGGRYERKSCSGGSAGTGAAFFQAAVRILQFNRHVDPLKLIQAHLLSGLYFAARGDLFTSHRYVLRASKTLKGLLNS